jgi:hypothetical protein
MTFTTEVVIVALPTGLRAVFIVLRATDRRTRGPLLQINSVCIALLPFELATP